MSEEGIKNPTESVDEESASTSAPEGMEIIVNRKTREITFKGPQGQTATLKATEIEDEEDSDVVGLKATPLTAEEFRDALQRLDDLGLTWGADRLPQIKPKTKEAEGALFSEEFIKVQQEYPALPRELSAITFHYYTGSKPSKDVVGDDDTLKRKVEIARAFFLNEDYRAEFFFKHAIKVPYFSEIDWEVVVKASEKNVEKMPGVAYALLSLRLDSPEIGLTRLQNRAITVAVDIAIVNRLIVTLGDVKEALEGARELTDTLNKPTDLEGTENDHTNSTTTEKLGQ